jgi:hypothetical protein
MTERKLLYVWQECSTDVGEYGLTTLVEEYQLPVGKLVRVRTFSLDMQQTAMNTVYVPDPII